MVVKSPRTARATPGLLIITITLLVSSCSGDNPRVSHLAVGISKDSALVIMGGQEPERPYEYLIKGQLIEALVFRQPSAEGPVDSLSRKELLPVVLVNGKVMGWGWKYWDSVMTANHIRPELGK